MKLRLRRIALNEKYTIGKLYVSGKYECDTLEDTVRDIDKSGKFDGGEKKIHGQTAIPYGTYEVRMDIQSPRFSQKSSYKKCKGYLPRLMNVPSFDGVLIHIGNYPADTEGCILVGKNTKKGAVLQSTATFWPLYEKLKAAADKGDKIYIDIV